MSRAMARVMRLEAMRPTPAGKPVLPFLCGPETPSEVIAEMGRRAEAQGHELMLIELVPAPFPPGHPREALRA